MVQNLKKSLFQEFIDLEFGDFETQPNEPAHIHIPPMGELPQDLPLPPPVDLPPEPLPVIAPEVASTETATSACTPRNLVSELFSARDKAHQLHLRSKSFAAHMALGDFYDGVLDLADQIAETAQGKYGILEPIAASSIPGDDAQGFIAGLTTWLDHVAHGCVPAEDTFLHNLIDEVQALAYRTKYKLDNLK